MKHLSKCILTAIMLLVCNPAVHAQWDLEGVEVDKTKWRDYTPQWNPNPNLLIPGAGVDGNSSVKKNTSSRNRIKTLQQGNELPDHWDNAKTPYFPPVFNQAGGSCGVSSRVGYMLTEELNAYRGTNASLPENKLACNFQYPFSYDNGTPKDYMAKFVGYPDAATYGGFPYSNIYGYAEVWDTDAGWMQGYDKWYKSMFNRIWNTSSLPIGIIGYPENNPEGWGRGGYGQGALAAKRYLYNHNGDESFHTGGLLGLGVACEGYNLAVPQTANNDAIGVTGKRFWVTGTQVDHAVTICGYDDRIEFDLDGNGIAGERCNSVGQDEKGAWIIVNSWGGWANNGFIYVPYPLAAPTCTKHAGWQYTYASDGVTKVDSVWKVYYTPNGANGFTPEIYHIRKDYAPTRTIKLKMTYNQRSAISLRAGISRDLNATEPEKTITFHHFNYQGNGWNNEDPMMPMLGKWADGKVHYEPMEFGYDLTDLTDGYDRSQPLKYFFIVQSNNTAVGTGGIHEASIVDYDVSAEGLETPFQISGDSVSIANQGGRTVISTIVYGEALLPPTSPKIESTTFTWQAPQGTIYTPSSYIVYKDNTAIGRVDGSTTHYDIGTTQGSFSVKAAYNINGNERTSMATPAIHTMMPLTQKYISYIGSPISSLDELTNGMHVMLYNIGRKCYVVDNGSQQYKHASRTPKTMNPDDCIFVFKISKSNNNYSFTSSNGSIPAFTGNNASINVSQTAGNFTLSVADQAQKTFMIKSGNFYLNGVPDFPVTWRDGGLNSQFQIIPVSYSAVGIESVGNYTSSTIDNLLDGQIVALYNNGRKYYMTDEGSQYRSTTTALTASTPNAEKYLFRLGRNGDGTVTLTSQNGAVPVLPYNVPFAPSDEADNFTLTSAGSGLFYLQSSTAVPSAGGAMERQFLDGNGTLPVGWNTSSSANAKYRIYPVSMNTSAPNVNIEMTADVRAGVPARFYLTGENDLVSCKWVIEGNTYNIMEPVVTFASSGNKTIQCTAVNMKGKVTTLNRTINVQAAPALTADFEPSRTSIVGGTRLTLKAANLLPNCTYRWNAPNADVEMPEARNTTVSFLKVGQNPVTLTVTAPDGRSVSVTKQITVSLAPPKPDFELSQSVILKGQSVTLQDKTLYNPTDWSWTMISGNGKVYQSNDQNPVFTPDAGKYEVRLTVLNSEGDETLVRKMALQVCNAPSYNGLMFSGGNNRVTTSLPNSISNEWTIDFWLKPTSFQSESFGISGSGNLKLVSDQLGTVSLKLGNNVLAKSKAGYYIQNEWHHYAISYLNGKLYFNRDGSAVHEANCSQSDYSGLFNTLQIGGSDAPCFGMFDEFRVWNTALPAAKLKEYAVAPISDIASAQNQHGLMLYYQFNQNSGNCTDATSNGNTGTRLGFGPDGDAWSESAGVFALNFERGSFIPQGGQLNQTLYSVADKSDEETVAEHTPATNANDGVPGSFWHSTYKESQAPYPHNVTYDRSQTDEIYSIKLFVDRANDSRYVPTMISVYESDDAQSWTALTKNTHLIFNDKLAGIQLRNPATKRFLKVEFPTGGTFLALNEIYFYGQDGQVIDNLPLPESTEGHTVTWRIYDETGTKLWKLYRQQNVANGTLLNAVPEEIHINGCNYSPVSVVVNRDEVIDVRTTWNHFRFSTPNDTTYYQLKLNGKYAKWNEGNGQVALVGNASQATDASAQWAFFGNPYSGVLVTNAAAGGKYLTGNVANNGKASVAEGGTRFNVFASNHSGGGFVLQVEKDVAFLNDFANGGILSTWRDMNAINGVGSSFKANEVAGTGNIVTWQIYDQTGTTLWHTYRERNVANGNVKSELPAALRLNGCEYNFTPTTVNGNTTIAVRASWNQFQISTPQDTTYYNIKLRGRHMKYDAETNKIVLENELGNNASPASKWALFGNPYSGFLVTNAASHSLYIQGHTQNAAHASMNLTGTRFLSGPSGHSGGGFLLQVGNNTAYLNDFAANGILATWTDARSTSDYGSTFQATDPGDFSGQVQTDLAYLLGADAVKNCVGRLSQETFDAMSARYQEGIQPSTNYSQYWSLLNDAKTAILKLENGKYYLLKNAYTGRYIVANETSGRLFTSNIGRDNAQQQPGGPAQFIQNENDTWQIRYLDMPLRSLTNRSSSYTVNPDDNYGYQEAEVQIYPSSDITFAFFGGCQGAQQYGYLHSNNSANVIGWTREGLASQWRLEPVDAAYIAALQNYAPAFGIINDDVTGIDGVEQTENWKSVNIYDLQGRRVTKPQRGNIYIIDGQKVKF